MKSLLDATFEISSDQSLINVIYVTDGRTFIVVEQLNNDGTTNIQLFEKGKDYFHESTKQVNQNGTAGHDATTNEATIFNLTKFIFKDYVPYFEKHSFKVSAENAKILINMASIVAQENKGSSLNWANTLLNKINLGPVEFLCNKAPIWSTKATLNWYINLLSAVIFVAGMFLLFGGVLGLLGVTSVLSGTAAIVATVAGGGMVAAGGVKLGLSFFSSRRKVAEKVLVEESVDTPSV